jgi:hypothetical protein
MLLQTILNHVAPQKSFTYSTISWANDGDRSALEVVIEPRRATRPICSGCRRKRPGYDRLPPRRYQFVPLWQIPRASAHYCAARKERQTFLLVESGDGSIRLHLS